MLPDGFLPEDRDRQSDDIFPDRHDNDKFPNRQNNDFFPNRRNSDIFPNDSEEDNFDELMIDDFTPHYIGGEPEDPPKKSDESKESDDKNIQIYGTMFSLTAVAAAGGTVSYGEFMYKGKSYGFVTYGPAFGIDGGACFSVFCISAPHDFDPLKDFSGKSSSNNISLTLLIGVTGSKGSSVSYNPSSDLYEANKKVVTYSLGPNVGLKAGYSHAKTETKVWVIPPRVNENDYNQFIR